MWQWLCVCVQVCVSDFNDSSQFDRVEFCLMIVVNLFTLPIKFCVSANQKKVRVIVHKIQFPTVVTGGKICPNLLFKNIFCISLKDLTDTRHLFFHNHNKIFFDKIFSH